MEIDFNRYQLNGCRVIGKRFGFCFVPRTGFTKSFSWFLTNYIIKKYIRAGSDLLLNISLSVGQSFKVDQITSAKRE